MRELHSAHQGPVCELQQSWPWREEPGHIALVNDWWHLQDLWSLKVAAPLKPHTRRNISRGPIPCWKLQEKTLVWFISVSSLLLLGDAMDGCALQHLLHWPALGRWQERDEASVWATWWTYSSLQPCLETRESWSADNIWNGKFWVNVTLISWGLLWLP